MSFSKIFVFFSVLLLACCSIPSKENVLERFCFEAQAKKYWLLLPKGPQGGAGLVCPSPAPPQQVSAMPSGNWTKTLCREQDKVSLLSLGLMSCTLSVYCALYTLPILGYPWKGSTVVLLLGPALYSDSTCLLQEFICSRLHCWWSVSLWYWSTSLG